MIVFDCLLCRIYGPSDSSDGMYKETCQPLVENLFEGYNATVFAYGQTGSGKTYTMGNDGNSSSDGMIPRTVSDIFKKCKEVEGTGSTTKIEFSYMEIYKEECYDLLANDKKKCDIRELVNGETVVDGLSHVNVTSENDVHDLLVRISRVRTTAKTAMNSVSSRSHAICTFTLTTTKQETLSEVDRTTASVVTKSRFHLVDLAGSERAKKTMASGDVFAEGVNINKGLLALGNVIVALSSGSSGHVPYRDSKITRILKDSLGGNSKTVMIACVSPADINFEETLNTLRFSSRASCIVNSVSVNKDYLGGEENSAASLQLVQEICTLREELRLAKQQSEMMGISDRKTNNHVMLNLFVKLATFTRSILVKCIEEDVEVGDGEIDEARKTIALLKSETQSSDVESLESSSEPNDLQFLPPIMNLVDELEVLEKQIKKSNRDSIESIESEFSDYSSSSTSSGSCHNKDDKEFEDSIDNDSESKSEVESKQLEVNYMIEMTAQCKQTISQLRQEVQRLEEEKQKVLQNSKATAGSNVLNAPSEKSKNMLKEKTKLLENKQKELRKKEIEYAKLMQQKEKAFKEVTILSNELKSAKRMRVEMARKHKQDSKQYMEEKNKLLKSEHQHRKRELEAQDKASKIQRELSNKEKFMSEKIADKDREIKRLKLLAEKQSNVKQQRGQAISSKVTQSQSGFNGHRKITSSRTDDLSESRIKELQHWIEEEVIAQSKRNYLQDEIKYQSDQRSKDTKRMKALKQQEQEGADIDEELRSIEEDIRTRSCSIAKAQGQLADLGVVVEKRRFAKITDLREAKVLMGGMFQKLSCDKVSEQRSMECKLTAQENEIRLLKDTIHKLETCAPAGCSTSRRRKSLCTESLHGMEMENAQNDTLKRTKIKPALPSFTKKSSTKKKRTNSTDSQYSDEEDLGFDIEDSFLIDDDDDDEDYIPESEQKRVTSKKRTSKELDAGKGRERKRSKGSDASSESEIDSPLEPREPYSQYTVPILKSFLAARSLPVSGKIFNALHCICQNNTVDNCVGRKDDLIKRLRQFYHKENSQEQENLPVERESLDEDELDKENVSEFNLLTLEIENMKKDNIPKNKRKLLGNKNTDFAPLVVEDILDYALDVERE